MYDMRKKPLVLATTAMLLLGSMGLAACGGNGSASTEAPEAESTATEDAEAQEAEDQEPVEKGAWVVSEVEDHSEYTSEKFSSVTTTHHTYKLDERGNMIEDAYKTTSVFDGQENESDYVSTFTYDDNGYLLTQKDSVDSTETTFENEYDDQGRPVTTKSTKPDQYTGTTERVYGSSGKLETLTSTTTFLYDTTTTKLDGSEANLKGYKSVYTYDKQGNPLTVVQTTSYGDGTDDSYTLSYDNKYGKGNLLESGTITATTGAVTTFTCEYDENGNLTKRSETREKDPSDPNSTSTRVTTYKYVYVENPSPAIAD